MFISGELHKSAPQSQYLNISASVTSATVTSNLSWNPLSWPEGSSSSSSLSSSLRSICFENRGLVNGQLMLSTHACERRISCTLCPPAVTSGERRLFERGQWSPAGGQISVGAPPSTPPPWFTCCPSAPAAGSSGGRRGCGSAPPWGNTHSVLKEWSIIGVCECARAVQAGCSSWRLIAVVIDSILNHNYSFIATGKEEGMCSFLRC